MSLQPDSPPATFGFLSILQEHSGWLGGYLVTNSWGRPLEFRLTTAVQPNRIHLALYGRTLNEYLFADLIGRTLVEKTALKPGLIVADAVDALPLASRVEIPVVALRRGAEVDAAQTLDHPRAAGGLLLPADCPASDRQRIVDWLDRIDPVVELAEPFARIREAIAEARKMGANSRAA